MRDLFSDALVDLFAGGGGASGAMEAAHGRPVDVAVNHDPDAIALHTRNHPETYHHLADVFHVDPRKAVRRRKVSHLHASPDCTFFSRARGGKPFRDTNKARRRRGLAGVVLWWVERMRPALVTMENVAEFTEWGPLDKTTGLPDPARRGQSFRRWLARLRNLGYAVDWRELESHHYGGFTSRKRFFLVARRDGLPIRWPERTHGPGLKPYRAAAEIIDWSNLGSSIFATREEARAWARETDADGVPKRPLAEKTLQRIARGIRKFVIEAKEPFVVPLRGTSPAHRSTHGVVEPLSTVSAGGTHHALVTPIVLPNNTNNVPRPASEPVPTATTGNRNILVTPILTEHANASNPRSWSPTEPLRTVCANVKGGHHAVVAPILVQTGYGEREGQAPRALDPRQPLGTVVSGGSKHAACVAFLARHFGRGGTPGNDLAGPVGALTSKDHTSVVTVHLGDVEDRSEQVRAFLVKYCGAESEAHDVRGPLDTVTTVDRFGLVTIHGTEYRIVDIRMRMLTPRELFRAQGFPDSYEIERGADGRPLSKKAQVRLAGNSVERFVAQALFAVNLDSVENRRAA